MRDMPKRTGTVTKVKIAGYYNNSVGALSQALLSIYSNLFTDAFCVAVTIIRYHPIVFYLILYGCLTGFRNNRNYRPVFLSGGRWQYLGFS